MGKRKDGPKAQKVLRKHGYGLVGRHSGVKLCHWLRKSLRNQGHCYKQEFYGIQSHRCLQMSPCVSHCNFKCQFCWRPVDLTDDFSFDTIDEPESIVSESLRAQRRLVSGFGGVPDLVERGMFQEAMEPKHAAISLAGEPTLYPRIGDLIEEYDRLGMTTFLVTNGSRPDVISKLGKEPTQLYVSLSAPDEETHRIVNNPVVPGTWQNLQETLELFDNLSSCRRVIRLTMVRDLNMAHPDRYAEMIEKASPDFVEVKAYMYVGWSRYRLEMSNMPSFVDIQEFSREITRQSGYELCKEYAPSRVVLLTKGSKSPCIE
jgi:tRNA wybutosine-synthesizing protein 1